MTGSERSHAPDTATLIRIENKIDATGEKVTETNRKVDHLGVLIQGSGVSPDSGIIIQLDRVKQRQKQIDRWLFAIGSAAVTALIGAIMAFILSGALANIT